MPTSVVMPALELMQETGKILSWRKKEGEHVTKGEALLEIETDKAVVEIEALADGIVGGVKSREGDVVPVGQVIAWILEPGEVLPADEAPVESVAAAFVSQLAKGETLESSRTETQKSGSKRIKASAKARHLARERGIDINDVRGTGAEGEILASDVLAAAESQTASSSAGVGTSPVLVEGAVQTLSSIGRLMAERTMQSWSTVPHFFVTREVDATALSEARRKVISAIEKSHGVRPTLTDLLVALVARVLVKHPYVNASWITQGIRFNQNVNIGIAMAVEGGVVAAVVHNANAMSLGEIAVQRHALTERARAGRLHPEDLSGATFTISNLGMYHVDVFTAIIVSPQAAILAVGAVTDQIVPIDGKPGVRPMMDLTLSSDHRVIDGVRAATFLHDLILILNHPEVSLG
jgi:pyruvate dehydrogenase E2 component (dihydrolipoyllysine-residue acetyltransferase)